MTLYYVKNLNILLIVNKKQFFQIKGALNRLAESNMHVIARQIEDLYMSNSRNLMNECLCQILSISKSQ